MRRIIITGSLWALCSFAAAQSGPASTGGTASAPAAPADLRRAVGSAQELLGAWVLRSIEYQGPHGESLDPYYQAGSTGILVYDASGWMSVQITARNRRPWKAPEQRVPASRRAPRALEAAAFDSYYAYYGRWDFDPATDVVIHQVEASLIPSEVGSRYSQSVGFEGAYLVFTNRSDGPGGTTLRRKIWERMPARP